MSAFQKKRNVSKKPFMVMNLCPSNIKMLLIAVFDLTGVMQEGTEWIFAHLCPIELGFKSQARVQWWQCAPSPTHLLTDWNLCHQGKKPSEIQGRDLAGPQLFSPAVHPLCLTSSGCGNGYSRAGTGLEDVTPRGTHRDVWPGLTWILVILTLD